MCFRAHCSLVANLVPVFLENVLESKSRSQYKQDGSYWQCPRPGTCTVQNKQTITLSLADVSCNVLLQQPWRINIPVVLPKDLVVHCKIATSIFQIRSSSLSDKGTSSFSVMWVFSCLLADKRHPFTFLKLNCGLRLRLEEGSIDCLPRKGKSKLMQGLLRQWKKSFEIFLVWYQSTIKGSRQTRSKAEVEKRFKA